MYQQPTHTFEQILKIQQEHLEDWKLKLDDACYNDLVKMTKIHNSNGYNRPLDVFRGSNMDNFIANWKPGKYNF